MDIAESIVTIKVSDLREKYSNLDVKYEQLFEFFTKIINKTNFYQNNLMLFNLRQITLEVRKDKHTEKVKKLIAKNYHNFEDLCKNNSTFRSFFEKNKTNLIKEKKFKPSEIELNLPTHIVEFYPKCENILNFIKNAFNSISSE